MKGLTSKIILASLLAIITLVSGINKVEKSNLRGSNGGEFAAVEVKRILTVRMINLFVSILLLSKSNAEKNLITN